MSLKAKLAGLQSKEEWLDYPGMTEGVRGMAFIEQVIKSGRSEQKWIDFEV